MNDESDRIARETAEVEAIGREWAQRTDEFLVGYVSGHRPSQFHTPALVEIQRRVGVALRDAGEAADSQAAETLVLNRRLYWLTVATAALTAVQTVTVVWPIIAAWLEATR